MYFINDLNIKDLTDLLCQHSRYCIGIDWQQGESVSQLTHHPTGSVYPHQVGERNMAVGISIARLLSFMSHKPEN